MKKYLVRAGFDPQKQYCTLDVIKNNIIGGNSGNLMFAYGVMNALTTEGQSCIPTFYKRKWSEEDIEYIDQNYNALILPLADAFRKSFVPQLREYTGLISRLSIPVIVVGVGLRAEYEPDIHEKRPIDDDVKAFVGAVLDHSSCLGLRGEITAQYLTGLGFVPERDFTVIGCPSIYMHGEVTGVKSIKSLSNTAINYNGLMPEPMRRSYAEIIRKYYSAVMIQQREIELIDMYYGISQDLLPAGTNSGYSAFSDIDYQRMKQENRVKFFLSVPDWLNYMDGVDLFIGARFHGTVAALLEGVPAVFTPFDARTRELAEYHALACLTEHDIMNTDNMEDRITKLDFGSFYSHHEEGLLHYIDFLKRNDLESIFETKKDWKLGESPMEKGIVSNGINSQIDCYEFCSNAERIRRKTEYWQWKGEKKFNKIKQRLLK